jgi:ceramide glucosyltransferase
MQWILYILLFTYLFSILLSLVATFFSSKVYLRPFRQNREKPSVAILKPIINIEPNLKENLISFFSQEYPEYQLSFCLEKKDQEIIKLIEEVASQYNRAYKIYTEPASVGLNPKINNIYKAFNEAEADWILISDSNVNAEKNYLEKLTSYIDENVASVSSTILGIKPKILRACTSP